MDDGIALSAGVGTRYPWTLADSRPKQRYFGAA